MSLADEVGVVTLVIVVSNLDEPQTRGRKVLLITAAVAYPLPERAPQVFSPSEGRQTSSLSVPDQPDAHGDRDR